MAFALNIPSPNFPMIMGPPTPVMTTVQKCNMQSLQTPSPVVASPDLIPPKTPELYQTIPPPLTPQIPCTEACYVNQTIYDQTFSPSDFIITQNDNLQLPPPLTPQIPCTEEYDINQNSYDQPFFLSEIIPFIPPPVDHDNISENIEPFI